MKNSENTMVEAKQIFGQNLFTIAQYNAVATGHDWVKAETLYRNKLIEKVYVPVIRATYSPQEMANYVNDFVGEDLYGWNAYFKWNAEQGVFEETYDEIYYRVV